MGNIFYSPETQRTRKRSLDSYKFRNMKENSLKHNEYSDKLIFREAESVIGFWT